MSAIRAWTAHGPGDRLRLHEFAPGPLAPDEVEVAVDYCGICHSDLSVLDDEWGNALYPLVPGHEAVGHVVAAGDQARGVTVGQRVGVGWNAASCMHCRFCLQGDQHLCVRVQPTIVGHHGAFAERVRAHWVWTVPIPEGVDASAAGPLLCGGITVFAPLLAFGIKPTQRVGVVGIGGLGHLALKFLGAWGCEVTAFTSSEEKFDEAKALGAHRVVSSRNAHDMDALSGALDMVLVATSAPLDWNAITSMLAPKGRLHFVGAVLEPVQVNAMTLIMGQRSVSGSPTGSRGAMDSMMEFVARHGIEPQVEHFPMSRVNDALEHLRAGKARYRIVLDADFT